MKINIDSDLLLKEVERNKKYFEALIFWRDVREIGASLLLFLFFLYYGVKCDMWSSVVLAFFCIAVGGFMIVDRRIQKRKHPKINGTLLSCIEGSLTQVKHQIWLLKNIFWWYLLPPGIGIVIFTIDVGCSFNDLPGNEWVIHFFRSFLIIFLFFAGIYLLNQYAVRKGLKPRKEELETLLQSLKDN